MTRSEHPAKKVLVIGDAVKAGKAKEAIDSAFRAAFWPPARG